MLSKKNNIEKINAILHKYSFIISPIIVSVILALLFLSNDIYPFGGLSISWCDGDQQFIPLLCDFKDILLGKSGFFLSGGNSGGMNFYGVFFFNLSSPFTFLCLLYEKSRMAYAFNVIVALKLIVSSVTFSILLKRKTKNFALVVFPSVLYAFSGYGMMYYQIAQWLDVYYMFPLVLLGLERIVDGKNCLLYTVSLFLCVLFQFYLSYVVVIFVCLYAFCYILFNRGEAKKFAFSFITSSVIAALLSAAVIIPCFLQYTQSMRTSSIIDSLAKSNFFPSINTTLPTYFCVALFFVFAIYGVATDRKNFRNVLFLLTLFPVLIEPIAKGWQTFNYMSFPTRYGFVVITLCIYLAIGVIERMTVRSATENFANDSATKGEQSDMRQRIISFIKGESLAAKIFYTVAILMIAIGLFIFSIDYYKTNSEQLSSFARTLWGNSLSFKGLALFCLFVSVFGGLSLLLLRYNLTFKSAVFGAIALCLVTEAVFTCNVYMVSAVTLRSTDNNLGIRMNKVCELEDLIKDDEYYRVKVNSKPFEVNMVGALGYNSLSHYTSLNGKNYMMTAKALGYSSYWMEVNSRGGTAFSDALTRNKYTIKAGTSKGEYATKSYTVTKNDTLFPSIFVLSTGEFYPDYRLERLAIQNEMFNLLTGESELFTKYQPYAHENVEASFNNGKFEYKVIDKNQPARLKYKITLSGKQRLYFDIFDDYTNDLREPTYEKISKISVSRLGRVEKSKSNFPTQNDNGIVDFGVYEDCSITVNVEINGDISARSFGVYLMDVDKLETSINRLIDGDLRQIANGYSCSINSLNGGYAFIPMPYEKGYTALVNGKEAKIGYFGGFMTVGLDSGDNEILFKYKPQGFTAGMILSLIGVAFFICYAVFKGRIMQLSENAIGKISLIGVWALGIAVLVAVYLFPVVVNVL